MLYPLYTGEPHLVPPSGPPLVLPSFALLTCGQNITISSSGVDSLTILCTIFNGSEPITTEVFKNGVFFGSTLTININAFTDEDFGNYTFIASTERCGSTSAVSWILPSKSVLLNTNLEC